MGYLYSRESIPLLAAATMLFGLTVTPVASDAQASPMPSPAGFSQEILDAHNKYRTAVGVPPLVWSDDLAAAAQTWVNSLSTNLQFAHDPNAQGQGENIWMGTTNAFSLTQMIDAWGQEQQSFQNGTFPNVSTTGNWSDVAHYSQIVWRTTTSVGCAGAAGTDGNYRLVCRYTPQGNIVGQQVF